MFNELREEDYRSGKYLGDNIFTTRYFITTNGLPMKKGDSYAMIQLMGAEYQAAIIDNLTIGGMTSWLGVPLIGTAKYSFTVSDNFHLGAGILAGTGSWASWNSFGLLPFGVATLGNNKMNLNFSAGYFSLKMADNLDAIKAPLYSFGGLVRISDRVSFVGDSFIYTKEEVVAVLVPGLRFDRQNGGAFQFGLAGMIFDGEVIPFPMPFISWFVKI